MNQTQKGSCRNCQSIAHRLRPQLLGCVTGGKGRGVWIWAPNLWGLHCLQGDRSELTQRDCRTPSWCRRITWRCGGSPCIQELGVDLLSFMSLMARKGGTSRAVAAAGSSLFREAAASTDASSSNPQDKCESPATVLPFLFIFKSTWRR